MLLKPAVRPQGGSAKLLAGKKEKARGVDPKELDQDAL